MHTKNNYTFPLIGEGVTPSPYFLKQSGLLLSLFLNHWSFSQEAAPPMYGISGGIFECRLLGETPLLEGDKITIHYRGLVQTLARDVPFRYAVRRSMEEDWYRSTPGGPIPMIPEKWPGPALCGPIRNEGKE